MTSKREAYRLGYQTGYDIASDNLPLPSDSTGEQVEAFITECVETECEYYRQFSPFEFTACEFNNSRDPDGVWDSYDQGVVNGVTACVKQWKKDNNWQDKERVE